MSEKDKFIDNIVKGMMDNKRSLVQRYGKDAESVAFAFATKKWEEKMEKSKVTESKVRDLIRNVISERNQVVNSKSYIEKKSLKENIKELTDEEYKIAKEFATKKGGKLAATGADDKTLYIAVTMPGKTDEVEFKLDKTGKELK